MNGGVVAIVPLRSLTNGKTRLASALSEESRARLTRHMFAHVVDAIVESDTVFRIIVVSPDEDALEYASTLDPLVMPLRQPKVLPGLIPALGLGFNAAVEAGASAIVILFADLPLLSGSDVRSLLRRDAPVIVAPDRHGTGTNALALRIGSKEGDGRRFEFQFGTDSYARHVEEAHKHGLDVSTSMTTGTAFDLDTAEDLRRVIDDFRLDFDFPPEAIAGLSPAGKLAR